MSTSEREAYDLWHAKLEVDRDPESNWHKLVREYLDLERDLNGKDLLEIGCGRGGLACWLAMLPNGPHRIVAADISPIAVSMGRTLASQFGLPGIEWEVGDIQHLAHGSGTFDTVISCETIEHVPDPGSAVSELARVLKTGGRLFVTTPNYLGVMGVYRLYLRLMGRRFTELGQPVNRLTMWPRTLAWIRRAGLRIQATDGVGHYLPFPGRPPIRLRLMDRVSLLTRWVALHSIIVAEKP